MIDYRIPQKELGQIYEQVGLDKEQIIILWKQFMNIHPNWVGVIPGRKKKYTAKPTQEHYIIYNALRGEPLFKGRTGKSELFYFRRKLEGGTLPSHPYYQFFYQVSDMVSWMDRITTTKVTPLDDSGYIEMVKKAHAKYRNWFSWLEFDVGGYDGRSKKRRISPLFGKKKRLPLVFLVARHLEYAHKELLEKIQADNKDFTPHDYFIT